MDTQHDDKTRDGEIEWVDCSEPEKGSTSRNKRYRCNGTEIHRVTFWRHRKQGCPPPKEESDSSAFTTMKRKRETALTGPPTSSGFALEHIKYVPVTPAVSEDNKLSTSFSIVGGEMSFATSKYRLSQVVASVENSIGESPPFSGWVSPRERTLEGIDTREVFNFQPFSFNNRARFSRSHEYAQPIMMQELSLTSIPEPECGV